MIRRACLSDATDIHRVHMESIRSLVQTHYSPQQIKAWCGRRSAESYLDPIEHKLVLVAEDPRGIHGFAQLDTGAATVEAVYVAPDSTRRGVGGRLLAELESHASALRIAELRVDSSLNAVAFYAQAGYSPVGDANHELEPGVSIPCVTMIKALVTQTGA